MDACSLTQPCRSFAAAIARTTAFGEVIVLDSAGYGAVTITKSVSIIAPPGIYAGVTAFSGDAITVDALGAVVALRGLSINGQGGAIGINLQHAARLHVEGCVISNMGSNGILHVAPGAQLFVQDTIVRNTLGTGIGVAADASVVLDHVRSEHNQFDGFYIVPGATLAKAAVTDSIFAWNGANGINVDSGPAQAHTSVDVERSTLTDNGGWGFTANGNAGYGAVVVARSAIHRNAVGGVAINSTGFALFATISENSIVDNPVGIRADGLYADVHATANAVATQFAATFEQKNGAYFATYSNNAGDLFSKTGAISPVPGN